MVMATQQSKIQTGVARPSGLAEALWACVLDDYLSEEEEGELSKIVGKKESAPWYLLHKKSALEKQRTWVDDPRDAKTRGGSDNERRDDDRDGTPGVWDDVSGQGMPPVAWLSLPQVNSERNKQEKQALSAEADWDTDWDMNMEPNRMEMWRQKTGLDASAAIGSSRQPRRRDSWSLSRGSSRQGSRAGSTPRSKSKPRHITDAMSVRSKSHNRSKNRRESSQSHIEGRQSSPSAKEEDCNSRQTDERSRPSRSSLHGVLSGGSDYPRRSNRNDELLGPEPKIVRKKLRVRTSKRGHSTRS